MSSQADTIQQLNNLHDAAMSIFRSLRGAGQYEQKRLGCAITIGMYGDRYPVQLTKIVGICAMENRPKYLQLSTEKPTRAIRLGHHSSWQSRNPEKGLYGGGFWFSPYYVGISGLLEADDDALAMLICERLGLCNQGDWKVQMALSGNSERYKRMLGYAK